MKTDGKTRVCGIIANPVEHSMSPLLQNLFAERTGINLNYVPFKVAEQEVEAAVKGAFALNILGMNVTVPHKQNVMPYLTDLDRTARAVGAVNTLVRTENGFKGYNTDVTGLSRTISEAGMVLKDRDCILIGAGGAAKAAAYVMAEGGASVIYVLNRNTARAKALAADVNHLFQREVALPVALNDYGFIPKGRYFAVQCTSVGMHPNTQDAPIEDPEFYENIAEAVEIIYTPEETKFMKLVRAAGGRVTGGLNMLLYQGAAAFELWNPGVKVGAEVIAEAGRVLMDKLAEGRRKEEVKRTKHLILIGFMGAGKTSVGMRYAQKHDIPIVDTDQLIEMTSGMSVSDIFAFWGEEEFRKRETQMLKNLMDTEGKEVRKTLVSVGGGLPVRQENRELLKQLGTVVYLRVKPETVLERLEGDTTRPLLQGEDVEERVEELIAYREPFYLEASHGVVDTDGKSFERIVQEIEELEQRL